MILAALHLALIFCRAAWLRARGLHLQIVPAWQKGRFYHYFFGTSYLAAVFTALLQRDRSRRERFLFVRMAALAAFFDDLDEAPSAGDNLEKFSLGVEGHARALLATIRARLTLEQTPVFEWELNRVFEAEARAFPTDPAGILTRTGEKGGHSVLLFRALLAPSPGAEEQAILFEFGRLVQLCDDIFDVWFDLHQSDGEPTVAVYFLGKNDVTGLIQVFENQVAKTQNLFLQSGFRGKKTAWAAVFFLVAVTRVALRHYQKLRLRHGALPLHDRAAMVVDMGRWANRLRVVQALARSVFFEKN